MNDPRIKQLFMQAIDLPADQRRSWLDAQTNDPQLVAAVLALFSAHDASPTLAPPVQAIHHTTIHQAPQGILVGQRIGEYEIVSKLGEGGFGEVFLAQQHEPLSRRVAFKVLHAGMKHGQVIERFDAERQVLAMMDHPNIARVFDAGATPAGQPFIVMEYVDGLPITAYCERRQLGLRDRLLLFAQVCMAVQHAHQKGIIHRDLKPSNILVSEVDGKATPKVIDFGVAKAVDEPLGLAITKEFQVIGTPQYMSPEQARYGAGRLDTRSDVYSLGAVLYELVTGGPPFAVDELRNASLDQMLRLIQEKTPARPSTKISQITASDKPADTSTLALEPSRLRKMVAGDVDWIVMKALEKEPHRRYQTSVELADDLERFLQDRPVLAGPPSRVYQFRKFTRRHRVEMAAAGLVLLSLISAVAVSTVMAVRARRAEAAAKANEAASQRELSKANAVVGFTEDLLAGVGPNVARGRDTTLLKEILEHAAETVPKKLEDQPLIDLFLRDQIATVWYDLGDLHKARDLLEPAWNKTETLTGQDAIDRLAVGATLAQVLTDLNENDKAKSLLVDLIARYEKLGMTRTAQYADTFGALAGTYLATSELPEGEKAARTAVELNRELKRSDSPNGTLALNTLANIVFRQGDREQAARIWEDLLDVQIGHYGNAHPDTFNARRNLGVAYRSLGKYDKALEQMELALEGSRKTFEPGSYDLVATITSVGDMHQQYGNKDRGNQLLEEAYGQSKLKLPPEHEARLIAEITLSRARVAQGRYAEAAELADEVIRTSIKSFGPATPRVAESLAIYIEALRADKKFDRAMEILKQYEPENWSEGTSTFFQASVDTAVANLFISMGRIDDAKQRLAHAKSIHEPRGRFQEMYTILDRKIAAATSQPAK